MRKDRGGGGTREGPGEESSIGRGRTGLDGIEVVFVRALLAQTAYATLLSSWTGSRDFSCGGRHPGRFDSLLVKLFTAVSL